jgi:hypothetical protein
MSRLAYTRLVLRALYELARYDVIHGTCGFGRLCAGLARQLPAARAARAGDANRERAVCDAVLLATCLYWKPVLCLQRSLCATRLLRFHGVHARLIIGYRAAPFFSHAWVEVDSRVVNDSMAYRKRLRILHSM